MAVPACNARNVTHDVEVPPRPSLAMFLRMDEEASPTKPNEPPALAAPAPSASSSTACAAGMILVEGEYCPNAKQVCINYADPPGPYQFTRCAEFKQPATCDGPREHRRYCIDKEEYVKAGEPLPMVHASWTDAATLCGERGARLCVEAEWQFACEGEEMRPYPYGFHRDSTACNFDKTNLGRPNEGLTDYRVPVSEFPQCVSPFGVHDMTGNVDEWTERQGLVAPNRSALHGGWWLPGRNNCRAATLKHGESYFGPQVGFRCCKDAG